MREPKNITDFRFMAILFLVLISDITGLFFNKTTPFEALCALFVMGFCLGGLMKVRKE